MSKDTITVELPIEAEDGGYVRVFGIRWAREYWREFAADPSIVLSEQTRVLAPAVVAWIERDEWKPLDLPDEGRTIKATMRDGRVETFKVREIDDAYDWARVWKDNFNDGVRFIQRVRDADGSGFHDIIAWEYVDEPTQPTISAEQVDTATKAMNEYYSRGGAISSREALLTGLRAAGLTVAGGE